MRILHVVESMDRGDVPSTVVEHVRHAAADVESFVAAIGDSGAALDLATVAGARTFPLGSVATRLPRGVHLARRLADVMVRERITVVHGHDSRAARWAASAALIARVPVVVRTEYVPHYSGRSSDFQSGLDATLTRFTRRILCACEAVRLSHAVRIPWAADRFVTVKSGVSAPASSRGRAAVRAELGLLESDRMVLAAGDLVAAQSHHVLIEAFHRVSRRSSAARLFLAGEGPRRDDLERQTADLGLGERVRFLGRRDDLPALMEAADVFALTSVREGVSVSLLESLRAGCPAVASRIGGTPEVVADGETGWLVTPNDPATAADALLHVLTDRARARAFSAAARDRWTRGFTAARMVAETERWYRAERAVARDAASRRARAASGWSDAPERSR